MERTLWQGHCSKYPLARTLWIEPYGKDYEHCRDDSVKKTVWKGLGRMDHVERTRWKGPCGKYPVERTI